ncbi:MAG: cyclic nucleotide-binding domain-containing protein [Gammaproteobacteria bacterium]|nr:cyclic nucleotide-binding domain-containing protein [Gammaproteobacteria bacterium]
MYHNLEVPAQCETLWQECQSLVPALLRDCAIKSKGRVLDASTPINPGSSSVYLIKEGEIHETYDGQLLVIHQQGDLVNADALSHPKPNLYETDFVVTVDEYDGQAFLDAIASDKGKFQAWSRYLSCLCQSYQLLMCYFSRQDSEYLPDFRSYKKGDVIIEENTEGDEVFTLLNGSAKVMSNNEEVGEIKKDEIFGAIAALTNTRRSATIVATSDCDTLVATRENFRSILEVRPDIVQKLIGDMARTIVSSNERIVELSKAQAQ